MKTTIRQTFEMIDLYTPDLLIEMLKNKYNYVSFTRNGKTIPKEGSEVRETKKIKLTDKLKISKIIEHKNGNTTIKADNFYFTFLNI